MVATQYVSHLVGHGLQFGSFVPELNFAGFTYQPLAVYTSRQVNIYFQFFRTRPPFESEGKRQEFLALLNSFLPKKLPAETINRQPGISMADIAKGEMGESFLKTKLGRAISRKKTGRMPEVAANSLLDE